MDKCGLRFNADLSVETRSNCPVVSRGKCRDYKIPPFAGIGIQGGMTMEKITINKQRYISLAEFNHLRRNLVKDIYARYEKDEDGKLNLSSFDQGQVAALTHIMTEIMFEEVHDAESPDEIREMHKNLDIEFALHRYVIVGKDPETGEKVFFRKYCEHIEEDEEIPVFTSLPRLAKTWTNYYWVTVACETLKQITENDTLKVDPAWMYLMPQGEAEKRLLNAIFGNEDGDKS